MSEPAVDDDSSPSHVVTAFLRSRGEILLLRRSDAVGTYTGRWGGVSGFAEGDPDAQVRVEIAEETGLADAVSLVRSSRPLRIEDDDLGRAWVVHPSLFDCDSREVDLSDEHDACEWVPPTAILSENRETVPALWRAYERVAPTVRSIAADGDHGAAWLSIRALEVLRDRAGLLVADRGDAGSDSVDERAGSTEEWDELADLARRLLEARPSMVVLRNRVNRAMTEADGRNASGVLESAIAGIDRATSADEEAARRAGELLEGTVATLSRSGTVLDALRTGEPRRVYVAESRPALEGAAVAEELAEAVPVTLHTDAAVATILAREDVDRAVVGADTILPDGSVVNKTGTRGLAIAAAHEGIPVTVVAASDKVSAREEVRLEFGPASAVYAPDEGGRDGEGERERAFDVTNPTFDVTPAACVTEFVTEDGAVEPLEVERVAEELGGLGRW